MTMRWLGSMTFAVTGTEMPYIFPVPLDLLANVEPSAAAGEPEFRGDVRVHEGLEHIGHRLADEHSGPGHRYLRELEMVHIVSFGAGNAR
jgi:hypothetical protein